MSGLTHARIARVFEFGRDGDMGFMSMQLIAGRTLKAWMATGGTRAQALRIIETCCEALEYSHALGIVHGDLKPTNIMVIADGTAKLIDFGSASVPGSHAVRGLDATTAATPLYASPQILAGQRAERLDDVFSLACLSYGILSGGRHPYGGHPSFEAFRAKSAPTYVPAIPVELFEVIERGLSADRERRPASVSEFRRELTAAEQHRRVKACFSRPASPIPVKKAPSEPQVLAPALMGVVPTIARSGETFRRSRSLQRVQPMVVPLAVLMAVVAGASILFRYTESMLPTLFGAARVSDAGLEAGHVPTIALTTSTSLPAPTLDRAPVQSANAVPLPHDSSSISFKAAIVHASARQSMVAITVQRSPANRGAGAFVWRVERGTAAPDIDYQRVNPRQVHFIEGQTVRTLFIPLVDKSTAHRPSGPRFFDVVLQPVAGGPGLGRFGRITVVIDPTQALWVARADPGTGSLR